MSNRSVLPQAIDVDVTTHDELPEAADYARSKVSELVRYTSRPVLHARVRLTKHRDPAVQRPVLAQANLDVDGRPVRAQIQAETAREAVDLLVARLRRSLERTVGYRKASSGRPSPSGSHEWRHNSEPTHRPSYFPRPPSERRVIRRKSFAMEPCTVDEAVAEMELLDYDFHLFTEKGTGTAAVVYRAGPAGYRLALVAPTLADQVSSHAQPVTVSRQPIPCLTEAEAADRLNLVSLPFLFYVDAAQGRASVLYHRYDGHYGLITPAG